MVIRLDRPRDIKVGKLGEFHFPSGYYVYVGSAMNSLEARIARHLKSENKRKHWHIDYLLDYGKIVDVLAIPSDVRIECDVAKFFAEYGQVVAEGFGSSDCSCRTHLFYFPKRPKLEAVYE